MVGRHSRGCAWLLVCLSACSGDPGATAPDAGVAADAADSPDAGPPCSDLRPVAACGDGFMWQGRQDVFSSSSGTPAGNVAIGLIPGEGGGPFLCHARGDGELVCDGVIAGAVFGFDTPAGVSDVVQVLAAGFGDLCALDRGGAAWCVGSYNNHGQLATGDVSPVSTFTRWGGDTAPPDPIVALGTGTSDNLCALTAAGELWCAGYAMGVGAAPAYLPVRIAGDVAAFYTDTFGQVHLRSPDGDETSYNPDSDAAGPGGFTACRVSNGRAEYLITSDGIVDGTTVGVGPDGPTCVLGNNGLVACGLNPSVGGERVLALAGSLYFETDIFAVRADGAVLQSTGAEVRPPGSVRVPGCP